MVGKTAAERKAAERERRLNAGWERFEFWLKPGEAVKVVDYILRIRGHKVKRRNGK